MELTKKQYEELYKRFIKNWKARADEENDSFGCPACMANYILMTEYTDKAYPNTGILPGSLRDACYFCPIDWSYLANPKDGCASPDSRGRKYNFWNEYRKYDEAKKCAEDIVQKTVWITYEDQIKKLEEALNKSK